MILSLPRTVLVKTRDDFLSGLDLPLILEVLEYKDMRNSQKFLTFLSNTIFNHFPHCFNPLQKIGFFNVSKMSRLPADVAGFFS